MSKNIVKEARKILTGKSGRLDDEELEYLAQDITKLGFKLGFDRAYAAAPSLVAKLLVDFERKAKQLNQKLATLGCK